MSKWPQSGWPRPGDKVQFLGRNGYNIELEQARELFAPGQLLTIKRCDVGDWRTGYQFEEHPSRWFNSVMFGRPDS